MIKNSLIIFVKNAELGKVKTRLAKDIGNEAALSVYKKLLVHTNNITKIINAEKNVFYSKFVEENDIWNQRVFNKFVQEGNDLGEKMCSAFEKIFDSGAEKCIIIGSDCFDITTEIIENAFEKLEQNDLAIGPAEDGGYYLLGMKTMHKKLFENKNWSTQSLFEETLKTAKILNLSVCKLPVLNDIDTVEDLKKHNEK